jgi:hypothetical protein
MSSTIGRVMTGLLFGSGSIATRRLWPLVLAHAGRNLAMTIAP